MFDVLGQIVRLSRLDDLFLGQLAAYDVQVILHVATDAVLLEQLKKRSQVGNARPPV